MVGENWRPVVDWEAYYEVSDRGNVRRIGGGIRSLHRDRDGYLSLAMSGGGRRVSKARVHILMLEAFIGERPQGQVCRHLDGNPGNNVLTNLRWGTESENQHDAVAHGRNHEVHKTHCPRGHPLSGPNLRPSSLRRGQRTCLACDRARAYCKKYDAMEMFESIADDRYASIVSA